MKRPTFISWEQLRVGAFIVIALALLIIATIRLGTSMHLFGSRYTLYTMLPSASGLRVGGSVSVAGQQVGTVEAIEFLPPDADTLRNLVVAIDLDESVKEQVRADSRVQLRTLGLLGDKTLDITPGTPGSPMLESGDTLVASLVLDYERLMAEAADAVDDMVALTSDLRTITSGLVRGEGTLGMLLRDGRVYTDLTTALRTSNTILARVRDSRGTFGRLLEDTALYGQLLQATNSVDTLAKRFASDRGTVGRLLSDSTIYLTLNRAALRADSLMQAIAEGRGSAGKFLKDEVVYEQLLTSVTELRLILEDFRRNPSKYTRGIIRIF